MRSSFPSLSAVAAAVLGGAILLSPSSAQALSAFYGSPDTTGVVALDCALVIVDCAAGPIDRSIWGSESQWDAEPSIVRVGAPFDYIGPDRKGKLYYFANLSPGRYQLAQFRSRVPVAWLHGETRAHKSDTFRNLTYDCKGATRDFFTVDVSPGSVRYLGKLAIAEAGYQKLPCPDPDLGHKLVPTRFAHVMRDSLTEAKALQSLRDAARGTPWEARLKTLPDSAIHAAPMDTTWAWSR